MTWYKIHLASKQHVQQLSAKGAVTPFMKMLIMKYDKIIPWKDVKTPELLLNYVVQKLLPDLHNKIDTTSQDNYYLRDVDVEKEYRNNPNDQTIHNAFNIFQTNKEAGKAILLEHFNEKKKEAFQVWNETLDNYENNPCFRYCVLEAAFKTSNSMVTTSCMPVEHHLIKKLHDIIAQGSIDIGVMNKYMEIADAETFKVEYTNGKDGWILIPSKKRCASDPAKWGDFKQNLQVLRRYGKDAGWCVGQDAYSLRYLSDGDFYLLTTGGRARVAIRMEDDTIGEVRGRNNIDENLMPYWEIVLDFIERQGINGQCEALEELKEKVQFNKEFESNEKTRKAILKQIYSYPTEYNKLNRKNRTGDAYNQCLKGWLNKLKTGALNIYNLQSSPPEVQNDEKIIQFILSTIKSYTPAEFIYFWNSAGSIFKTNEKAKAYAFSPAMNDKIAKAIANGQVSFKDMPKEFITPEIIKAGVEFTKSQISQYPNYNIYSIPDILAEQSEIKNIIISKILTFRSIKFYKQYQSFQKSIKSSPEIIEKLQKSVVPSIVKMIGKYTKMAEFDETDDSFIALFQEMSPEIAKEDAVKNKGIEYLISRSKIKNAQYNAYLALTPQQQIEQGIPSENRAKNWFNDSEVLKDQRLTSVFTEDFKMYLLSTLANFTAGEMVEHGRVNPKTTGRGILSAFYNIPEKYKNTPEIKQTVAPMVDGLIDYLVHSLQDDGSIRGFENTLAANANVFDNLYEKAYPKAQKAIQNVIENNPHEYGVINEKYKPYFNDSAIKGWVKAIEESDNSGDTIGVMRNLERAAIPPEIKQNENIKDALMNHFIINLKTDPYFISIAKGNGITIEESILKDPRVIESFRSGRISYGAKSISDYIEMYEATRFDTMTDEYRQVSPEEKETSYNKLLENLIITAKSNIQSFYNEIRNPYGGEIDQNWNIPNVSETINKIFKDKRLQDAIAEGWANDIIENPSRISKATAAPRYIIENPIFIEKIKQKYPGQLKEVVDSGRLNEYYVETLPDWMKNIPEVNDIIKYSMEKSVKKWIPIIRDFDIINYSLRNRMPLVIASHPNIISAIQKRATAIAQQSPDDIDIIVEHLPNEPILEYQLIANQVMAIANGGANQVPQNAPNAARQPRGVRASLYSLHPKKTLWKLL